MMVLSAPHPSQHGVIKEGSIYILFGATWEKRKERMREEEREEERKV